jgi:hypothetical protein
MVSMEDVRSVGILSIIAGIMFGGAISLLIALYTNVLSFTIDAVIAPTLLLLIGFMFIIFAIGVAENW